MPPDTPEKLELDTEEARAPGFSTISGFELTFQRVRILAGLLAAVMIAAILVFSLTDLSAFLLPLEERHLQVLIPRAANGPEPFVLNELMHELEDNRLAVEGRMTNESVETVSGVVAIITARDTTGRFPATIEAPVDPNVLAPGESGWFSMSVTLRERPDHYSVRFKLEDGPLVPHRDERGFDFNIVRPPVD